MSIHQQFLERIAEAQDLPVESLRIDVEIRTGGPTVSPRAASENVIESRSTFWGTTVVEDQVVLPSAEYDGIGSKHLDFMISTLIDSCEGTISVPRSLYAFQIHPFAGNCGLCINRWVRVLDENEWSDELVKHGLTYRAAVARFAMYGLMVITTGNSFSGDEHFDSFENVYQGTGRGPVSIQVLDLRSYLRDLH